MVGDFTFKETFVEDPKRLELLEVASRIVAGRATSSEEVMRQCVKIAAALIAEVDRLIKEQQAEGVSDASE